MAEKVLFKIGETDLTDYLDQQNFKMDKYDMFESWTDGNWVEHRVISRQKITGKAAAGFSSAADFSAFCELLESEREDDGYYVVTAYINNTGTTETFEAFLSMSATSKWDWVNECQWIVQTITVTQR